MTDNIPSTTNGVEKNAQSNGAKPKKQTRTKPAHGKKPIKESPLNQFQKSVEEELAKCDLGSEIETLKRIIMPDPWVLSYQCTQVKNDLQRLLQPLNPVRIDLFGSIIMGIALHGSDLDFYIQLDEPERKDKSKILYRVKSYLQHDNCFNDFEVVSRARIPILKCVHVSTGFQCDLNFTNNIGVYNSPIMATLLTFDARIFILAMLLKYWMKVHNLIGSNAITSYAALWLLLFYLQQLKEPLLPPIQAFQRQMPPFFIGDNCANLAFNFSLPNLLQNTQRLSALLSGFFEFYEKSDFENQLLCPLSGRAFPQNGFETRFPEYFQDYKELLAMAPTATPMQFDKPICIQDPFEICHTIPGKVSREYFLTFRIAIANAAIICRTKLSTGDSFKEVLLALFDNTPKLPKSIPAKPPALNVYPALLGNTFAPIELTAQANELKVAKQRVRAIYPAERIVDGCTQINSLWAFECMHHVIDTLKQSYGLTLTEFVSPTKAILAKTFEIARSAAANKEIDPDGSIFTPLNGVCRIWANHPENTKVTIDFYDSAENQSSSPLQGFHTQFKTSIGALVSARLMTYGDTAEDLSSTLSELSLSSPESQEAPIPTIDTVNLQKPQSFKYTLTPKDRGILRKYLTITKQKVYRRDVSPLNDTVYSKLCIEAFVQILNKIFGFDLVVMKKPLGSLPKDSPFSSKYHATGYRDVFSHNRAIYGTQFKKAADHTRDVMLSNGHLYSQPLKLICHILRDKERLDNISIDFYDLESDNTNSQFKFFCVNFKRYFVSSFFGYSCEYFIRGDHLEGLIVWDNLNKQINCLPPSDPIQEGGSSQHLLFERDVIDVKLLKHPKTVIIMASDDDIKICKDIQAAIAENSSIKTEWSEINIKFVEKILTKICGFEMRCVESKLDGVPDGVSYEAKISYNVYLRRKKGQIAKDSFLTNEILVTQAIIKGAPNGGGQKLKPPLSVLIHIWATDKNTISVNFYNLNKLKDNELNSILGDLRQRMSSYLTAYLERYAQNYLIESSELPSASTISNANGIKPITRLPPSDPIQQSCIYQHLLLERDVINVKVLKDPKTVIIKASDDDIKICKDIQTTIGDNSSIKTEWSEINVKFIEKILTKICGFQMRSVENKLDGVPDGVTYEANISHDVYLRRRNGQKAKELFLANEISVTHAIIKGVLKGVGRKLKPPLISLIHIWATDGNTISVNFYNLNRLQNNEINSILGPLRERMSSYLSAYLESYAQRCLKQSSESPSASTISNANGNNQPVAKSSAYKHRIKPLPSDLNIVKQLIQIVQETSDDETSTDDSQLTLYRFWAQTAIDFLIQILKGIFRFEIEFLNGTDTNLFSKRIKIKGEYDVVHNRRKLFINDPKYIEKELEYSNSIKDKMPRSHIAQAIIDIRTDERKYDAVIVEFDTIKVFNQLFEQRIRDYLTVYFQKHMSDALNVLKEKV